MTVATDADLGMTNCRLPSLEMQFTAVGTSPNIAATPLLTAA